MSALKAALSTQKCVATRVVSLPMEDAHIGHHMGNGVAGFSQRMNEKVVAKIAELVAEGITEVHEGRRLLRHYIMHDLCRESPPNLNDRAYFPIDSDLKNHIYMEPFSYPVLIKKIYVSKLINGKFLIQKVHIIFDHTSSRMQRMWILQHQLMNLQKQWQVINPLCMRKRVTVVCPHVFCLSPLL